jgi:predicted permease
MKTILQRLGKIFARLRQRRGFEHDLQAELQSHLELRTDDLMAQGMPEVAAKRQAKIEFGMLETHKANIRESRGLAVFDGLAQHWKSAFRTFKRYPTLCLGSALILGLTLAGLLALLAIDQTYRSAAPDALRRGMVFDVNLQSADQRKAPDLDDAELASVQAEMQNMADAVLASRSVRMMPSHDSRDPSIAYGVAASGNYFAWLSHHQQPARAQLGRTLQPNDDHLNAAPVVVLSAQGWRRLMPQASNPIGQTLRFANTSFTVVGVMPDGFVDLQPITPHFWVSNAGYAQWRNAAAVTNKVFGNQISLIGAGDHQSIEKRLTNLLSKLATRTDPDLKIARASLHQRTSLFSAEDAQDFRMVAAPVYALAGLVLLVVCANLANLMLAKALAQQQELAIRASIGASRRQLIVQLVFDSILIALLATVIGVLLSALWVNPLHHYLLSIMAEAGLSPLTVSISPELWFYGLGISLLASLVFGLLPALTATRTQLLQASKRDAVVGADRLTPSKLRGSLCVSQIACSFVLLVMALSVALLAWQMRGADIGYETNSLIDLHHPKADSRLRETIEGIPGVQGTTAMGRVPLYGSQSRIAAELNKQSMMLGYNTVDERFLTTFNLSLLGGRNFDRMEASNQSPVALISASTARQLWPGRNPVGQSIRVQQDCDDCTSELTYREVTVIGIIDDVISGMLFAGKDQTAIYLPGALGGASTELVVAVRPELQQSLRQQLIATCIAHDAAMPCNPWLFTYLRDRQQLMFVIAQNLCGLLAALALVITMIGLFGVVRYNLGHRQREIGVRLAIGATSTKVAKMLIADIMRHVRWGLLVGLPFAVLSSYAVFAIFSLAGITTMIGFASALIAIVGIAQLAAWLPTRVIKHMSPMLALRDG